MDKKQIEYWISQWEATGRAAFYHPRQGRISLNGGRSLSVNEAIRQVRQSPSENEKMKKSPR